MKNTFSIKKNSEFSLVYKKGKRYSGKLVILYVLKSYKQKDLLSNYVGITASKKTGKSVKRNRLKRLVKENYRAFEPSLSTGFFMVFVLRSVVGVPDFWAYSREMKYLLKKANILELRTNEE